MGKREPEKEEKTRSTIQTKKKNKRKIVILKMLSILKVASFFLLASQGVTCSEGADEGPIIGIDLGTTYSCGRDGGGKGHGDSERPGQQDHPVLRCLHRVRRTSHWRCCKESVDLKPQEHHLRRQEADRSGMGRLHSSRGRQVFPLLLGEEGQQASSEGDYGRPWRQATHT